MRRTIENASGQLVKHYWQKVRAVDQEDVDFFHQVLEAVYKQAQMDERMARREIEKLKQRI
jgi:cell division septum initiation protein DivIVA